MGCQTLSRTWLHRAVLKRLKDTRRKLGRQYAGTVLAQDVPYYYHSLRRALLPLPPRTANGPEWAEAMLVRLDEGVQDWAAGLPSPLPEVALAYGQGVQRLVHDAEMDLRDLKLSQCEFDDDEGRRAIWQRELDEHRMVCVRGLMARVWLLLDKQWQDYRYRAANGGYWGRTGSEVLDAYAEARLLLGSPPRRLQADYERLLQWYYRGYVRLGKMVEAWPRRRYGNDHGYGTATLAEIHRDLRAAMRESLDARKQYRAEKAGAAANAS